VASLGTVSLLLNLPNQEQHRALLVLEGILSIHLPCLFAGVPQNLYASYPTILAFHDRMSQLPEVGVSILPALLMPQIMRRCSDACCLFFTQVSSTNCCSLDECAADQGLVRKCQGGPSSGIQDSPSLEPGLHLFGAVVPS
jgi:hypothetical protein